MTTREKLEQAILEAAQAIHIKGILSGELLSEEAILCEIRLSISPLVKKLQTELLNANAECGKALNEIEGYKERITQGVKAIKDLQDENDVLKGIIAQQFMCHGGKCHYCGVDSIAKCPHGFPGCALADDISGCEEVTAAEIRRLREELAKLKGKTDEQKAL